MLDPCIDQGDSLRRLAPQAAWSVVAMVSQGDAATEQPLLWQICAVLQSFSYQVTVLDATSTETEDNPGLQNLLERAHWLEDVPDDASALRIVPARRGLSRLARLTSQENDMPLQPLGNLFRNCDVVVLYAGAEMLGALLPSSQVRPLLAVTELRTAVVSAYQNLKKLLLQAQLVPLLVSIATPSRNNGQAVQHCAQVHLGCHTECITVRPLPQPDQRRNDIHQLALRLMASAIPFAYLFSPAHGAGSH